MNKVVVKNVDKYYNHMKILSNVNMEIKENECVGIMGESGSGKSTLAKLMSGLEKPDKGELIVNDFPLKELNYKNRKEFYEKTQIVFQNSLSAVNNKFTIMDILMEPLNIHFKNKFTLEEKKVKIYDILEKVGLSKELLMKKPTELSGGQLQRVCIGRALILEPKIVIFDESLSGLDPIIQYRILKLLGDIKEKLKLTYIFIAHDFKMCYYLCDRVFVMKKGEVIDIIENIGTDNITYETEVSKEIVRSIFL